MSLTIKNSNRSIKRSIETQKNAQPFLPKRSMRSLKCKEKKRNEGRVNKKRRVEDVEKVEKFVNQFAKRLRIDDE